ncbi:Bug family tripartite tricarboxylate transporter substrate binding protein [Humitalea sp. 24SJ18S-53]|uniref:Bug family tripartite tricarboxylate transporter substrate binding protein n=1 Tax=Humitalea sp. 24SJ18S-53 TaxID=3422307 RepID=UPI003D67DCAE
MTVTITRRGFAAFATLAAAPSLALAQANSDWPSRAVTLVVPWAAGGSTDAVARILANRLTQDTGRGFVVDNRTGANGTIGFGTVARARPDGYTMLVSTVSTYAMAPHLMQVPYDNERAFVGIGLIAAMPMILVVPKASPYQTLAQFIAAAKSSGSRMVYANSGTGSSTHLATELFLQSAGIEMPDVGYRGGAPAVQGVLANEAQMIMQAASGVIPLIQSGDLRALAISSRDRSPVAPEVPTFREQGFPEYEVYEHIAVQAPAGTPEAIVRRMNALTKAAMENPDTVQRLAALAVVPTVGSVEDWGPYFTAENAKWREVIRSRNIRLQ